MSTRKQVVKAEQDLVDTGEKATDLCRCSHLFLLVCSFASLTMRPVEQNTYIASCFHTSRMSPRQRAQIGGIRAQMGAGFLAMQF